jgi:uncharacterized damage-inducible protein DinB
MTTTASLAYDNIHFLRQALGLLDSLDDESYRNPYPPFFASGIGAHLRHNLDHYQCFLGGLATRQIDYDARARDHRLETDRDYAAQQMQHIVRQLEKISEPDTNVPVLVKMDSDSETELPATWRRSTVGRELQFLVSHTVHHYALIAVLLRLHGLEPSDEFGCAPSTLRYQRDQSLCAPQPG